MMTTPSVALERPQQPRQSAAEAPQEDAVSAATRRFAQTGDDSELVALGVLPVGKPLPYHVP